MSSARLRQAGEALYGRRWQAALARDLGVTTRTVQRWRADGYQMPDHYWPTINTMLASRRAKLEKMEENS